MYINLSSGGLRSLNMHQEKRFCPQCLTESPNTLVANQQ